MIEHIRKYSGLMIAVLVLIFISFFFMDTGSMRGLSGAPDVLRINGRGYSEKDFHRAGAASQELIIGTAQSGDFGLYMAFAPFFSRGMGQDDAAQQLFVGRMLIRQAREEYGINPDDEEVSSYIRKMRMFAGPDGNFDQETYTKFIQQTLPRFRMTERDIRDLAEDAIISQKLQSVLSSGLGADRDVVARTLALDNQQIDLQLAKLDLDTYQDKIEPKEEEIKAYWETIKDSYKTEARRKFTYVLVTPAAVADAPVEAAAPLAADATEEAKAAAKKAEEDKKAAAAAKTAEARRKALLDSNADLDEFIVKLGDNKGSGFEELAKEHGWEVKTTELFPLSAPPEDLKLALRATSQPGNAANALFKMTVNSDPVSKISEAIPVGENQTIVARLDAEEAPRVKDYAEARADARAQYISEKGVEALKTATTEAATKIKASLTAGKSFADAAKEAGITGEVKSVSKVTSTYRPDAATEPQGLFEAARNVDPGTLADNAIESDRSFLIYVAKREVVKEPNAAERVDAEIKNQARQSQMAAFDAWLTARIDAAKIEELYNKKK